MIPITSGINNVSWRVDARGTRYVLRIHSTSSEAEVEREHRLLLALAAEPLPFATPRPVPTRTGATHSVVTTPRGPRVAALFEWIDGTHLDDDAVEGVEEAGAAFALLDSALARMRVDAPDFEGWLDRVHPAVPDLDHLPELGADGMGLVRRMAGEPSQIRASLSPRQLIHDDFAFGNVLMRGGRVAGIVDFEFTVREARAVELGIALRLVLSKRTRERLWRPLLRGYLRALPLEPAEIMALPTLALHHEAVVLIWWLGRFRSGDADARSLDDHIARALAIEPWIAEHGSEVISFGHKASRRG